MEQSTRSTLLLCGEVYGHNIRRTTQLEAKKCPEGGASIVELTTVTELS
jgi:hypothetical protein